MKAKDKMKFLLSNEESLITVVADTSNNKFYKTEHNLAEGFAKNDITNSIGKCYVLMSIR